MQCGTTQQWLEETVTAAKFWHDPSGHYYFETEDGKVKYYPINNTIVEEI